MDYIALKQAILANPECSQYVITNDMPKDPEYYLKDKAIADIFNAPQGTRLIERYENAIGLMSALGSSTAAAILEKLETASASIPALRWAMYAIKSDHGINIGDIETQNTLDALVPSVLTQEEANSIKNLAIQTSSLAYQVVGQPVTAADVSIALRNF